MMRTILVFLCAAIVMVVIAPETAIASNLFFDNFESGVNSTSTWALVNAGQSLLNGDTGGHHLGVQSAKQVNAFTDGVSDVYYMKTQSTAFTNPGPIIAGNKEVATVQFWDENIRTEQSGDNSLDIRGALMLAGSYSSTDFYQLGVNSSISATNYFWRTAAQGSFATGVARTQGWHELRIEALPYTGSNDVQFYIDNVNVASGNRRAAGPVDMNEIRLGISVRTPDSPFWFDNVSLDMVPEPASIFMLGLGSLAFAGYSSRMRSARRWYR